MVFVLLLKVHVTVPTILFGVVNIVRIGVVRMEISSTMWMFVMEMEHVRFQEVLVNVTTPHSMVVQTAPPFDVKMDIW